MTAAQLFSHIALASLLQVVAGAAFAVWRRPSTAVASAGYDAIAERTWQLGAATNLSGATLGLELVRCATLAPSSHNTQCWKFALDANGRSISILPDLARRCPAVDPDDHHLFVSLGCATRATGCTARRRATRTSRHGSVMWPFAGY